jgi:hypothetical protein
LDKFIVSLSERGTLFGRSRGAVRTVGKPFGVGVFPRSGFALHGLRHFRVLKIEKLGDPIRLKGFFC